MTNSGPKSVAEPTSARATVAVESEVRNIELRANDSFQLSERVASRLQCSVARNCARRAGKDSLAGARSAGGSGWLGSASVMRILLPAR